MARRPSLLAVGTGLAEGRAAVDSAAVAPGLTTEAVAVGARSGLATRTGSGYSRRAAEAARVVVVAIGHRRRCRGDSRRDRRCRPWKVPAGAEKQPLS